MKTAFSPQKTRVQFTAAVTGKKGTGRIPWKAVMALIVVGLIGGGDYYYQQNFVPRKGPILFGICRTFIEQKSQFPGTIRIIEYSQRIPPGENQSNPMRVVSSITYSSTDGFGQSMLNTFECTFRRDPELRNTPWQGIVLERTTMIGQPEHGWADVYVPGKKEGPRKPDDRSDILEEFFVGIPAILAYPPDLTLPTKDLKFVKVEDLQDL